MTEVRRCGGCATEAAVCVRDWKHSRTRRSIARDFRCQACGRRFTLRRPLTIALWGVVGVLFALFGIGLLFLGYAAYLAWQYLRNPVAPNAAYPPLRFDGAESMRRCTGCRGAAACVEVTRESRNFVPTGTTYRYVCATCRAEFDIVSAYGVIFMVGGATLLNVIGVLTVMVGIGVLFLLVGLGGYVLAALAVLGWLRHPKVS